MNLVAKPLMLTFFLAFPSVNLRLFQLAEGLCLWECKFLAAKSSFIVARSASVSSPMYHAWACPLRMWLMFVPISLRRDSVVTLSLTDSMNGLTLLKGKVAADGELIRSSARLVLLRARSARIV
jgi:hypothetical protein